MKKFIPPLADQRALLLAEAGEQEGLCRDKDRQRITSLSRSRTWQLEKEDKHPKRIPLGSQSIAWRKSDLLAWIAQLQSTRKVTDSGAQGEQ